MSLVLLDGSWKGSFKIIFNMGGRREIDSVKFSVVFKTHSTLDQSSSNVFRFYLKASLIPSRAQQPVGGL